MRSESIIEVMMTKVKSNLQKYSEQLDANLTVENAEIVTKCLMNAVMDAALGGFKTYIEENEKRN